MSAPEPVAGIYIPDDSRDELSLVYIDLADGGYHALQTYMEGEPEEVELPGRRDVVAFVNEAAMRSGLPRNLRATLLLTNSLPAGGHVAGPCLLVGQQADEGVMALPASVSLRSVRATIAALAELEGSS